MILEKFKPVPWDTAVFGIPAYEILDDNPSALKLAMCTPGHYTLRIDPLKEKRWLHEYGFYYCDTLIEPYCSQSSFVPYDSFEVDLTLGEFDLDSLMSICHGAFSHGRFHRDFNLSKIQADQRYDNWLLQLHNAGKVHGIFFRNELTGFIAVDNNKLVLHAIAERLRGRGLAKYLWTPVCKMLFEAGHSEITSSVSSTNLAIVNLYSRLGFGFRDPVDIYHRITK